MKTETLTEMNPKEVADLLAPPEDDQLLITLLMPMERKGAETRKNHIYFKNALADAEKKLTHHQEKHEKIGPILQDLKKLDDPTADFWQNQLEGLAMVVSETGDVAAYKVPIKLDEFAWVGSKPYLSPLVRLLGGNRFYILVLDQGDLKLYRATRWQATRIELENVPTSFEEAMKYDDPEKSVQWRTVSSSNEPGPGGGDAVYHGHGVTGDENHEKKVQRFFEMVDKNLPDNLRDPEAPLVLFGGDSEIGHYREVNQYRNTWEEAIAFGPGNLSDDELEKKICEWVAERDAEAEEKALEDLGNQLGQGKGSTDFEKTIKAAADGLVSKLFVKAGEKRYGVNNRQTDKVTIHDEPKAGDNELIGCAAADAARTGAEVHYVNSDRNLPDNAVLAAVLRY